MTFVSLAMGRALLCRAGAVLATALIAAACRGEGDPPAIEPMAPVAEWTIDPGLAAGEVLAGYEWDRRGMIRWSDPTPPARIEWGRWGAGANTAFHLHFDGSERGLGTSSLGEVQESDCDRAAGRHGESLRLRSASSQARVRMGGPSAFAGSWTIELWLWIPSHGRTRPGRVLTVPGLVELALERDGRLRATVDARPGFSLVCGRPVRRGEWNHVALSRNEEILDAFYLVVGDEAVGRPTAAPGDPPRRSASGELILGSPAPGMPGVLGCVDELFVHRRFLTSEELFLRGEESPAPGEHTLTMRLADGTRRTLAAWYGATTAPILEGEEAWAQGRWRHAASIDGALTWTPGDWERIEADSAPLPRTTHATAFLGDHRIFLFGGETLDTHVNVMANTADTWIFRTDEETWRRVATTLAPAPRCHQTMAYSPDHDVVLCFGGLRNTHGLETIVHGDTWLYHVAEERWEERRPGGVAMRPECNQAMVYYPPRRVFLLLQGPRMAEYSPDADAWTARPWPRIVAADGSPARYAPGGCVITGYDPGRDQLVLFGGEKRVGEDGDRVRWAFSDTTAIFDLATNTLTVLDLDRAPSPRVRAGFAHDPRRDRFVLFGGVQDEQSERQCDLWVFDPAVRRWTQLAAANLPTPRGGYFGMDYDPDLDRFFLTCGRSSPTRFLNDTWSLHLDETAIGTALFTFDRASFGDRGMWFSDCRAPGGGAVVFRFRGGPDGVAWGEWATEPREALDADSRFVQVEVELRPGRGGEPSQVLRMGFDDESGGLGRAESGGDFQYRRDVPLLRER
ncbi:MAG: kelch repeat-containing protein [Planctomycetota bacterium]